MGANAQTSVPLFASGEVLTAANQNLSAGTGVPVFATTVTRDAAFGGAGEKVLAEGQLAYIEASDVVQYYDGTSWATLGPATASALVVTASGSFTTASSFNTAASTFTATYRNYMMVIYLSAVSTSLNVLMQGRTGSTTDTTTTIYWSINNLSYVAVNSLVAGSGTGGGRILTAATNAGTAVNMTLFSPEVSTTPFTYVGLANDAFSASAGYFGGGTFTTNTNYDALTISTSTGTISGTYTVYGLANS
jgi:hypothetical protein